MSKIAVVYWSGTGNTKVMAEAVKSGAEEKGAEAVMLTAAEFDASMMDGFFCFYCLRLPVYGSGVA